jgi:hypothetical protein
VCIGKEPVAPPPRQVAGGAVCAMAAVILLAGSAVLCSGARYWRGPDTNVGAMVVLASKAGPKLLALKSALGRIGWLHGSHVSCCAARSGVPDQPCGYEETRRGADNRLAWTKVRQLPGMCAARRHEAC